MKRIWSVRTIAPRMTCSALPFVTFLLICSRTVSASPDRDEARKQSSTANRQQAHAIPRLDKQIELTVSGDLPSALKTLSSAGGISIIADAAPTRKFVTLTHIGSVRQALDKVSSAYDYRWSLTTGGIVLFTRKYSDPNELPQMNYAEIRQTAADMLTILPALDINLIDPDQVWIGSMMRLADSMTPTQVRTMKSGKTIGYADLAPPQQRGMSDLINSRAFGAPRGCWYRLNLLLNSSKSAVIESRFLNDRDKCAVLTASRTDGPPVETRVANYPAKREDQNSPQTDPSPKAPAAPAMEVSAGTANSKSDDPVSRNVAVRAEDVSLGKLLAELSRACETRIACKEAIAGHKIHVYAGGVSCRSLLDSLCEACGWTWRLTEADHYLVTRWTARRQRGTEQIARAMQKALPRDLRDYLGIINWDKRTADERQMIVIQRSGSGPVDNMQKGLSATLAVLLEETPSVKTASLPAAMQDQVACVAFFSQFRHGSGPLYNALDIQIMVPERSYLRVEQDNILLIDMLIRPNYPIGFGGSIVGRR